MNHVLAALDREAFPAGEQSPCSRFPPWKQTSGGRISGGIPGPGPGARGATPHERGESRRNSPSRPFVFKGAGQHEQPTATLAFARIVSGRFRAGHGGDALHVLLKEVHKLKLPPHVPSAETAIVDEA